MRETITRRFEFDYGHRVLNHKGKCKYLHGHRGVALVSLAAAIDTHGMIYDFGDVKKLIGGWIDENWDHNFLLHKDDPLAWIYNESPDHDIFKGKSLYIMQGGNPTAELMARELFVATSGIMRQCGIEVVKVVLYETPNSYATYDDLAG